MTTIRETDADKLLSVVASGELELRDRPHIVVARTVEGAMRYYGPFDGIERARRAADALDGEPSAEPVSVVEVVPLFPA